MDLLALRGDHDRIHGLLVLARPTESQSDLHRVAGRQSRRPSEIRQDPPTQGHELVGQRQPIARDGEGEADQEKRHVEERQQGEVPPVSLSDQPAVHLHRTLEHPIEEREAVDTGEDQPEPAEPSPESHAVGDALEVGLDLHFRMAAGHLLIGEGLGLASCRHGRLPRIQLFLHSGESGSKFFDESHGNGLSADPTQATPLK